MSKYKERGPYHFVEYADKNSIYHSHVNSLIDEIDTHTDFDITPNFYEVGCGEGLILWQMSRRENVEGHRIYAGNDADELAVDFANLLLPPWITVYHSANVTKTPARDVVLFADSLEHIETWREHLLWASKAKYVIIAVPSIRDKHAINVFGLNSFKGQPWTENMKCVYSKTRHYRHVTIWVNQLLT
jgi:hypothetical protein